MYASFFLSGWCCLWQHNVNQENYDIKNLPARVSELCWQSSTSKSILDHTWKPAKIGSIFVRTQHVRHLVADAFCIHPRPSCSILSYALWNRSGSLPLDCAMPPVLRIWLWIHHPGTKSSRSHMHPIIWRRASASVIISQAFTTTKDTHTKQFRSYKALSSKWCSKFLSLSGAQCVKPSAMLLITVLEAHRNWWRPGACSLATT